MHFQPAVTIWRDGRQMLWEDEGRRWDVVEVLRAFRTTRGTELFRLHDHVRRFCRASGCALPAEAVADGCRQVVRVNSLRSAHVLILGGSDVTVLAQETPPEVADHDRFCVRGRVLHAPPSDRVMRDTIVTLACALGVGVRQQALDDGDEAFLAGADGIVAVKAGPVTAAIEKSFADLASLPDSRAWFERVELWPPPQFAEAVA